MPIFQPEERQLLESLGRLADCNPFVPEFVDWERSVLGAGHEPDGAVWSLRAAGVGESPAFARLGAAAEQVARRAREQLLESRAATLEERTSYARVAVFVLYQRHADMLHDLHRDPARGRRRVAGFRPFRRDLDHFLDAGRFRLTQPVDPAHLFACFYQVRRAFHLIYRHIVGASRPAARLRAAVWESIFTHDVQRYWRLLHDRMHDVTTLITGPSGTGKELVARAIGLSRYIPFDADRETFADTLDGAFHAVNLAAMSPTLIESELFGHRKGAFTGAVQDRVGWLESCPALGTVLLDEVGEIDASIQIKLLRVLQTREFQRVGETTTRAFKGKLIAATNRDLEAEMRAGRFREDLYYRLCSDLIVTPSLRDQLRDAPEELRNLVLFVSERVDRRRRRSATRGRGARVRCARSRPRLPLAGQCPRARAVRAQRAGAQAVPAPGTAGAGFERAGPGRRTRRRAAHRPGAPPPLLHDGLRAHPQLPGDGPPPGARPPHGEAAHRPGAARTPRADSTPS